MRKRNMAAFIIVSLVSILIPVIIVVGTSATVANNINPIHNSLTDCPLTPCYSYAFAPNTSALMSTFKTKFMDMFNLSAVNDISF